MIRRLAQLDPNVLRLVLVAVPAMVALVGWGQILRPAWQARQTAVALHASTRQAAAELPARRAESAALSKEAEALELLLEAPDSASTRLPLLLERLATAHGVDLLPVFPGRDTEFEGLLETVYEIEASAPYPRLVAWLADIDARLINAGVSDARFSRLAATESVTLKLRLAVYRRPATPPTLPVEGRKQDDKPAAPPIRHDPFRRPAGSPNPAESGQPAPPAAWQPTLRGVLLAGKASLANVDGQMVALGETLEGHRLVSISDHQAVFEKDGRRMVLDMRRPMEPRP
jgi:hypothetical protein